MSHHALVKIYYSQYDKHHYIDFQWVQCNEPATLALGSFRILTLISTIFAVVIDIVVVIAILQATDSNANHIL